MTDKFNAILVKERKPNDLKKIEKIIDDNYKENYDRIFKTNPVAKEVRTPKFKSQVVKAKKGKGSYNRKHHDD